MLEARGLVEAWAAPWLRGVTPAVVSAVDVLVGDVLQEEQSTRPDGPLVDAAYVDLEAIRSWTGAGTGVLERLFAGKKRALLRRLEWDESLAAERVDAWRKVEEALGEIPWTTLAPMEVVSLSMGHFGPPRQPTALPVIASFLAGTAASTVGPPEVAAAAARSLPKYAAAFGRIARTSSAAFEELGRRARARGHAVPDPFGLPIPAYLPLLG